MKNFENKTVKVISKLICDGYGAIHGDGKKIIEKRITGTNMS